VEKDFRYMSGTPEIKPYPIVTISDTIWQANADHCRANCSGYLKQVAARLVVPLPDVQANQIVDYLSSTSGWLKLANNAQRASQLTTQGYFVIAGLKASDNGHVAVVVPGWAPQGYPMGYWGSMRGAAYAGANQSLTLAWTRADLALVSYYALPVPTLNK
jgi:hypothetical protein